MAEKTDLFAGQQVRVYGASSRRPGGFVVGRITRVGRTRVDIEYTGAYKAVSFYIDTQRQIGESYGYGVYFKTLDQAALQDREARALETLRQHGLGPILYQAPKATLEILERVAEAVLTATEHL